MKIKHVRIFIIGILLLVVSIIFLIIRLNLNKSSELISTQSPNTNEVERTTNHLLPTNSKSSSSLPLARNEGWGTHYRLADCDKLLTYFFENPNNYYGIYDLQEDLGQPGSPDWCGTEFNYDSLELGESVVPAIEDEVPEYFHWYQYRTHHSRFHR